MPSPKDTAEYQIFKSVLLHCVIVLATPVLSFFASKFFIFDGLLGFDNIPSNVYSAVVAMLVLHVALATFLYRSYKDDRAEAALKTD